MNALGGSIAHRVADGRFSVTLRFRTLPEQDG